MGGWEQISGDKRASDEGLEVVMNVVDDPRYDLRWDEGGRQLNAIGDRVSRLCDFRPNKYEDTSSETRLARLEVLVFSIVESDNQIIVDSPRKQPHFEFSTTSRQFIYHNPYWPNVYVPAP